MSHRFSRILCLVLLALLAGSLISCGKSRAPVDNTVNIANFKSTVLSLKGYVWVLFYNEQFWQSQDMEKRFDHFSNKYRRKLKSFKFHWNMNDDGSQYGLDTLPTVVLYHDGFEIDRIRNIPETEKDRHDWNRDIDLWILKNVLEEKGNQYTSDYSYRFNNTPRLQISNF